MCGIIAQVNRRAKVDTALFDRMRDTMTHRGPDDAGTWIDQTGSVALGHRRLSIIDLSENGRQPMANEDGNLWLSFNGEIYNFVELRKLLAGRGHTFSSNTDSEVILHAYEEWGDACVERLWGMFAFVIWDDDRNRLFGARDRLGVKPLHYHRGTDTFICASEIKAILPHPAVARKIDRNAVCDFLTYRYIAQPRTVWQDVRKLPPGYAFSYAEGRFEQWQYWKLQPGNDPLGQDDALLRLDELLTDSVARRMVSDVPVGVFLSGGLDSSAIAWQMKQLDDQVSSYTIGFGDPETDETPQARLIAEHLGLNHHERDLGRDAFGSLDELATYFDEPFGASSALPLYLVSRVASQGVKVILTGDGGDEAFAGYNWYDRLLAPASPLGRAKMMAKRLLRGSERIEERYRQATTPRFTTSELSSLFAEPLIGSDQDELWFFTQNVAPNLQDVKQLQWLDTHTFLPEEVLTKVDRASMAHSLEVRSPFLDHRLFEWIFSLDPAVYFGGEKKRLLRRAMKDRIPETILHRPKRGFSAPIASYWNEARCNDVITSSKAVKDGLFTRRAVDALIAEPSNSRVSGKKWLLVVFDAWYRRWYA